MATLVEVYVNTDIVGGLADGSSLANAYATQWAAEAGSQRNWVTADQYGHILCYATAGTADPTAVGWAGHTVDNDHQVTIIPGTGQEHSGVWSTSIYRMSVTNTYCVSMQIGFVNFVGIQMESNFSVADYYSVYSLSYVPAGAVNSVSNCLIQTTNGGHLSCMSATHTNMTMYVSCCIFGPAPYRAIYTNAGNLYTYNNTIVGCATNGMTAGASSAIFHAINNIVSGSSTDIVSSAGTSVIDYNLTTSGSGTHAQTPAGGDWTTVFTNVATRDFSILNTGTAYNTGTTNPISSTDAIGNTFATPDMGALAYVNPYIYASMDITGTGTISISMFAGTTIYLTTNGEYQYLKTISGSKQVVKLSNGTYQYLYEVSGSA